MMTEIVPRNDGRRKSRTFNKMAIAAIYADPPPDTVGQFAHFHGFGRATAEFLTRFGCAQVGCAEYKRRFVAVCRDGEWPWTAAATEGAVAAYLADRPDWTRHGNIWHGPDMRARVRDGELIVLLGRGACNQETQP